MTAVVVDGSEGSAYVRILQQLWKCFQHPHVLTMIVFILPVIYCLSLKYIYLHVTRFAVW